MNPIERTTQNMPMVAMRGVVIFPKMVMHFDVAREASIQAVNAAYASDHQLFLVAQRDIFIEEPEQKDLYEFGVIAEVRQVLKWCHAGVGGRCPESKALLNGKAGCLFNGRSKAGFL